MSKYQNYRPSVQPEHLHEGLPMEEFNKNLPFFSVEIPKGFNGGTWDAKHMTDFLSKSNYSNWRGQQRNISNCSNPSESTHKRCFSTHGDHFFRTTRVDKNQSKIGFTPIFPLVSNAPIQQQKDATLSNFLQASKERKNASFKTRCSNQEDVFRYEANAVKFKSTDPITLQHEQSPEAHATGFQKARMNRLIDRRHPHGMTGIDHPLNPETKYYTPFDETIRVRQEPNSGHTFLIDRDWKKKGRSVPPAGEQKEREAITIRRFRNQNSHGFNILTNRVQ